MLKNPKILTEPRHTTYIDMLLNPKKLTHYQMDVSKAKKDIRDECVVELS